MARVRHDSTYSYDQLYNSVVTAVVHQPSKDDKKEKKRARKKERKDKEDRERKEREKRERSEERQRRREEKEERKKRKNKKAKHKKSDHETIHYITSTVLSQKGAPPPTNFHGESMTYDASVA